MANQTINVAVVRETLHAPAQQDGINVSIREERLEFSSSPDENSILAPVVEEKLNVQVRQELLAFNVSMASQQGGGNTTLRVDGVAHGKTVIVDVAAAPCRALKWLLLVTDDSNALAVSSEINAHRKGSQIRFVEFALMGDTGLLHYELDVVEQADSIRLTMTSLHHGLLSIRAVRIGLIN